MDKDKRSARAGGPLQGRKQGYLGGTGRLTSINLDQRHFSFLDALALEQGVSRSMVVRRIIDQAVNPETTNKPD